MFTTAATKPKIKIWSLYNDYFLGISYRFKTESHLLSARLSATFILVSVSKLCLEFLWKSVRIYLQKVSSQTLVPLKCAQ
jgi:hypothetical protein